MRCILISALVHRIYDPNSAQHSGNNLQIDRMQQSDLTSELPGQWHSETQRLSCISREVSRHYNIDRFRPFYPFGFLGFDLHVMLGRHSAVIRSRLKLLGPANVHLAVGDLVRTEVEVAPDFICRIVWKSNARFNSKSLQRSFSTPMCINKIRRTSATASGLAIAP